MKKIITQTINIVAPLFFGFMPFLAKAQEDLGLQELELDNASNADIYSVIGGLINVALSFLGILAVLIIMWGGFLWMVAGSDLEKVDKAKRTIFSGIIGMIIILSSFIIARFVITTILRVTGAA